MAEERIVQAAYGNVSFSGPADEVDAVINIISAAEEIGDRRSAILAKAEKRRKKVVKG